MRISDWSSDVCSSDLFDDDRILAVEGIARREMGAGGTGDDNIAGWINRDRGALGRAGRAEQTFQTTSPSLSILEIGRTSGRERVCQYVLISVVAVPFK